MKLNCDNPAAGQWAVRGALPDSAGQSIILKDRGRRFPAACWIGPFSVAGGVFTGHLCTRVWTLNSSNSNSSIKQLMINNSKSIFKKIIALHCA